MDGSEYYRIYDTGDGYKVIQLRDEEEEDYDESNYVLPVKFFDEKRASEILNKLTYGINDREYMQGMLDGLHLSSDKRVSYDYE